MLRFTFVAFLIIISLFVIFSSCKKDILPAIPCNEKSNSIDVARKYLTGNYTWIYTEITLQGGSSTETPNSTGLNYTYVFEMNGRVKYYENNVLKSTDAYVIDYEYRVTTFPSDSATIVIINDIQTGQRKDFFRTYLCSDSALFYNPHNSIDFKKYFKRN